MCFIIRPHCLSSISARTTLMKSETWLLYRSLPICMRQTTSWVTWRWVEIYCIFILNSDRWEVWEKLTFIIIAVLYKVCPRQYHKWNNTTALSRNVYLVALHMDIKEVCETLLNWDYLLNKVAFSSVVWNDMENRVLKYQIPQILPTVPGPFCTGSKLFNKSVRFSPGTSSADNLNKCKFLPFLLRLIFTLNHAFDTLRPPKSCREESSEVKIYFTCFELTLKN